MHVWFTYVIVKSDLHIYTLYDFSYSCDQENKVSTEKIGISIKLKKSACCFYLNTNQHFNSESDEIMYT